MVNEKPSLLNHVITLQSRILATKEVVEWLGREDYFVWHPAFSDVAITQDLSVTSILLHLVEELGDSVLFQPVPRYFRHLYSVNYRDIFDPLCREYRQDIARTCGSNFWLHSNDYTFHWGISMITIRAELIHVLAEYTERLFRWRLGIDDAAIMHLDDNEQQIFASSEKSRFSMNPVSRYVSPGDTCSSDSDISYDCSNIFSMSEKLCEPRATISYNLDLNYNPCLSVTNTSWFKNLSSKNNYKCDLNQTMATSYQNNFSESSEDLDIDIKPDIPKKLKRYKKKDNSFRYSGKSTEYIETVNIYDENNFINMQRNMKNENKSLKDLAQETFNIQTSVPLVSKEIFNLPRCRNRHFRMNSQFSENILDRLSGIGHDQSVLAVQNITLNLPVNMVTI